jgi:hypothetical protein
MRAMLHRALASAVALVCLSLTLSTFAEKKGGSSPARDRRSENPETAAPPPQASNNEALIAAADEIVRQVSALRGLRPKGTLSRGVLTREQIGQKLRERIAEEYTTDEVHAEARVLKRLGLLPADLDYAKVIVDVLMEQVAGFYDPFAARLYIADWLPLEMQRPALAHEIEHALQDQYFNLKRFAEPIKDDGDRQLAHSALVEGDGTAVMLEFQAQAMHLPAEQLPDLVMQIGKQMLQGSFGSTPLFDQAPRFIKETLIFPYIGGLSFVESFRKNSPWKRVDELFREPPDSTEQVMHPEKYLAHEAPQKVTATPLAALAPWKEIRQDVLGELEWSVLLSSKVPREVADKAAAGWGGDRLVAYANAQSANGAVAVIDYSVWDTDEDAKEAEVAIRTLMAKLAGRAEAPNGQPAAFVDADGDEWTVERRDRRVLCFFGAPKGKSAKVAAEVWRDWKVSR